MKYLLLIYDDDNLTEPQAEAELAAYKVFNKEFAGKIIDGDALRPTNTVTTVRTRDGRRLTTDGPYAKTKEALGGYYLVNANDLDEAIAIAGKIPGALTGAIEVRPIRIFELAV